MLHSPADSPESAETSKPKKKVNKCHHYCSVPGCKTAQFKDYKMSFHTFPREGESQVIIDDDGFDDVLDRREAWSRRTYLGKRYNRDITAATYVCSRHFELADFCSQEKTKKRCRRLKRTAVPSLNLPPAPPNLENSDKYRMMQLKFRNPPETSPSVSLESVVHDLSIPRVQLVEDVEPPETSSRLVLEEPRKVSAAEEPRKVIVDPLEPKRLMLDPLEPRRPDQGARTLLEMFEEANTPSWEFAGPSCQTDRGVPTLGEILQKMTEDQDAPL
ncbi:hypothetical protein B566_EDAN010236 [Ephemera danica]|nr:hypothetical protein B566_EDAN010236 [Ephemera danica]